MLYESKLASEKGKSTLSIVRKARAGLSLSKHGRQHDGRKEGLTTPAPIGHAVSDALAPSLTIRHGAVRPTVESCGEFRGGKAEKSVR